MTRKKTASRDYNVLYGVHPVVETIKAGRRPVHEVYLARDPAGSHELKAFVEGTTVPLVRVSADQIQSIAGSLHHQGVAAKVGPFPYTDFQEILSTGSSRSGLLVILDEVQDPANLGSILRSAECLGACAVMLAKDRAVPITPAVEKASSGAAAHVPVARVVNLVRAIEQLKREGWWIYAADSRGASSCFSVDLSGRASIVLGSEGRGIRRLVRERCDGSLFIPMTGKVGSLNVSQAAAIILAESLRQRLLT
ncbi:MAG: 23S rRNA (guanosine(2251)-2'-O)-methyltransferase RlmB [Deltaproteobacteria bacterium]|nr:23S rRNA (guanosine(2251)-2'-O)-methyltransferase RlmB [Deltaproteobacteria bacterium]